MVIQNLHVLIVENAIEMRNVGESFPTSATSFENFFGEDLKGKASWFYGNGHEQDDSEIAIFEASVYKGDNSLIDANIVSDSGAFTNYVNASFAESLGRNIQNVSAQTGTGTDGNKIIATKAVGSDLCLRGAALP